MLVKVVHLEGSAAGRLIIVGDIHGCADQLRQLLVKTQFTNDAVRRCPELLKTSPQERTVVDDAARMQIPSILQPTSSPLSRGHASSCSSPEGQGGPALDDVDSPASSLVYNDHTGSGTNHGQLAHSQDEDVCVFVGDLVNKGPDSYGVVRTLRDIGAIGVVGNHDVAMLRLVDTIRAGTPLTSKESNSSLLPLALSCPDDVYAFLNSLPHLLCFHAYRLIVTHAGIDPSIPPEMQAVEAAIRMRNLVSAKKYIAQPVDATTQERPHVALSLSEEFATLERPKLGKSWSKTWSRLACKLNGGRGAAVMLAVVKKPREAWEVEEDSNGSDDSNCDDERGDVATTAPHRDASYSASAVKGSATAKKRDRQWLKRIAAVYKGYTIVYGHDAKRRLRVHPYAYGLDTGCVYGGELTCLVWPNTLVSVPGSSDSPPRHKSNF